MTSSPAGYSGTPLAKKIGIREGSRLLTINAPADYAALLEPLPAEVQFESRLTLRTDIVHLFAVEKKHLETKLKRMRTKIRKDAMVWVSWPKKSSKVPTDITEDVIREVCLPLGFVDVKVCAVSEVWSGLKLVIRKELRA
ncbi:MAG: hypothetical protein U0892_02585 [Pirellulales bacterium]